MRTPRVHQGQLPLVPFGYVGMPFTEGDVARTASGRTTTPFPRIDLTSDRRAWNTVRRVEGWLMSNALAEARARGDDFNACWLAQDQDLRVLPQASKDCAEQYLFDQPLRSLNPMRLLIT